MTTTDRWWERAPEDIVAEVDGRRWDLYTWTPSTAGRFVPATGGGVDQFAQEALYLLNASGPVTTQEAELLLTRMFVPIERYRSGAVTDRVGVEDGVRQVLDSVNATALVEVAHLLKLGDYQVGGRPLVDNPDALPGALAREIARRIKRFGRPFPPAPPGGPIRSSSHPPSDG